MDAVTVSEAKATLSQLVQRALDGEVIAIGRRGAPEVVLRAYQGEDRPRSLGFVDAEDYWMAEDFDAPLDDVAMRFDPDAPDGADGRP
jgi:prevent-host-death family protein